MGTSTCCVGCIVREIARSAFQARNYTRLPVRLALLADSRFCSIVVYNIVGAILEACTFCLTFLTIFIIRVVPNCR
jgi:hypothetical protein